MKKEDNNQVRNAYKFDSFFGRIPSWLKILFLKYWAAGAAFFFFGMGLSFLWMKENEENSLIYLTALLILGYCLVQEYVVKPIVRLMRNSLDDTYYFNMINLRGIKSLLLNFLYAFIVIVPLVALYGYFGSIGIKLTIFGLDGIDPFVFGLGAIVLDFIYLFIKNAINNYRKKLIFKDKKDATL